MTTAIQQAQQVVANRIGAVITSATFVRTYEQTTGVKLSPDCYPGPVENRADVETLVQKGEGQPLEVFNKFVGEYISGYLPGVDTARVSAMVEAAHEPATSPAALLQSIGDTVKPVEVQGSKNKTFFGIQLTPPQDVKVTAIKAALAQENQREIYFPVDEKVTLQGQQVHCYVLVWRSDLDKVPQAKGWVKASPEEAAVVEIFSRSHGNKKSIFEGLWVETAENAAGVCVLDAYHLGVCGAGRWDAHAGAVLFRVPESQILKLGA